MELTYEQLFDSLRREKSRDELQQLEPDFYKNVQAFLSMKKASITTAGETSAGERAKIEKQNAGKILKELYERRERKIVTLAMHRTRTETAVIDTSSLMPEEKILFDELVQMLISSRKRVLDTEIPYVEEPEITETPSREDTGEREISVKFLAEVPKFVGRNLQVFGPYEEGSSAKLPESVAQILIKKGRAVNTS